MKIQTVREFTQVFKVYAQFEELSLCKNMENLAKYSISSLFQHDAMA